MYKDLDGGFENDVKEYGIQTCHCRCPLILWFENDVKEYGIQTIINYMIITTSFENDVKEYGIQTIISCAALHIRLRMM